MMSTITFDELTNQIMTLQPDEKALLAHRILESLGDFVTPETEQKWLEEAERRWREIEEGKVRCIPAREAMKKAKAGLKKWL